MLNRSASLAMSTSVLEALPGKLDIKIHSTSVLYLISHFRIRNPSTGTWQTVNTQIQRLHNRGHQVLHYLLRYANSIFRERNAIFFMKIITCDPSIYTMDHPDLTVCNFMENSIGLKWVNIN